MEKEESEERNEATFADSADKTKVLCQTEKDILITHRKEQGFRKNHIVNLNKHDQRRNQQHHHNTIIFNYPSTTPIYETIIVLERSAWTGNLFFLINLDKLSLIHGI